MAKILFVDDDKTLVSIYEIEFKALGFEFVPAYSGLEALEKAHLINPDVIILDVMMPKMDGITTLIELRSQDWGKSIPVIVFTNLNLKDEHIKIVEENQPAWVLLKANLTPNMVSEKVAQILQKNG